MKPLTKWDPFNEIEDMQNSLTSWFGRTPMRLNKDYDETIKSTEWAALVDISEDDNEYDIKAELKKEDVKVTVENGTLSISGNRKFEKEEKNKKYHRIERSFGSFQRSFTVPEGTDPSKIRADFKHGILDVHLPKDENAKQ